MIELRIEAEDMAGLVRELRVLADKIEHGSRVGIQAGLVGAPIAAQEEPAKPSPAKEGTTAEQTGPAERMFGKTDPDRSRRLKAQIEEDDEIAVLAEKLGVDPEKSEMPATALLAHLKTLAAEAEQKPNISETPEDRKDPNEEPETPTATRDELLTGLRAWVNKVGMAEAQAKMKEITGYEKQSEIPDDPAVLGKALAAITAATNG